MISEGGTTETPSEQRTDFDKGSGGYREQDPVHEDESSCCGCCKKKAKPPPTEREIWWKKRCTIGLAILGFILNIVSLAMAISAWQLINDYTNEFAAIVDTWEIPPLVDLQLTTNTSCPAGYTDQSAAWYNGIYDACNCEKETHPNKTLTSSCCAHCDDEEKRYNCKDFAGIDGFSLPFFNDTSLRLCATSGGQNALQRIDYSNGCPDGYQVCGNASQASLDFVFCWVNTTLCPITDMLIVDVANETIADEMGLELQADTTIFLSNLSVFYKRGGSFIINGTQRATGCKSPPDGRSDYNVCPIPLYGFPIIEITTQSLMPCYLDKGYGWPGRSYSTAMNQWQDYTAGNGYSWQRGYSPRTQDSGCNIKIDNRYIPVYSRSERDLWKPSTAVPNAVPTKTGRQIPYPFNPYQTAGNGTQWYIAYRTETQWQNGCSVSRARIQQNSSDVDQLREAQLALIILTVIAFIIVGFFGCYLTIQFTWKDNDGNIEKGEEGYAPMCCMKIVKYSMQIGMYSCVIASVVLAFGLVAFFRDLTDATIDGSSGCTDAVTEGSFTHMRSIVDDLSKKDMIQGFTNMFDFFQEIGHFIINQFI